MIALLCAVSAESRCASRFFSDARRQAFNNASLWTGLYAGIPALLVQTGMGRQAAGETARWIVADYPVSRLVSFGFAGGLEADLAVGDLVIYRRLAWAGAADLIPDERLCEQAVAVAGRAALPVRPVTGVMVDQVVSGPAEKRSLAAAHRAQAVDMESYCLAQVAAEHGVPFLAVRVISDAIDDRLPPLERWSAPGGWHSALYDLTTQPGQAAALFRLAKNVRKAQFRLGEFFRAGQEESGLWN